MAEIVPFEFKQCSNILKSTGKKARTLAELRDVTAEASEECIFHHTYQYFLKGHILEYTNDFAHWAGESLEERALAEMLSNIDLYTYTDINQLRGGLLDEMDDYLERFPTPREAIAGDEFYFNEAVTMIFPAGLRAKNLAEFLIAMKYLDHSSIYYHFFEARMRHGMDDFSKWFESVLGKTELAERIRAIDPFMHSTEGIRECMIREIEKEVGMDMEAAKGD